MNMLHTTAYVLDESAKANTNCHLMALVSSNVRDRDGESIDQAGWELGYFRQNPVMLAGHKHVGPDGSPTVIGRWPVMEPEARGLLGGAEFDVGDPLGELYKGKYDRRFMRAFSVGFMSLKRETRSVNGKSVLVHAKCELIEVSACAVPCNPQAMVLNSAQGGGVDAIAEQLKQLIARVGDIDTAVKRMMDRMSLEERGLNDDADEEEPLAGSDSETPAKSAAALAEVTAAARELAVKFKRS